MNEIGLGLFVMIAGIVGFALWRRTSRPLSVTRQRVRCPISGDTATVAVATDLTARSREQYLAVESCSLLSDATVGVPERVGYLADIPACRVRLEPARPSAVYTEPVGCSQDCVFMLNVSAVPGAPPPALTTYDADNAIELAGRVCGNARIARLLGSWGG